MSEEGKNISKKPEVKLEFDQSKPCNINPDFKRHKEGDFHCETELEQNGKILCCFHNPITGAWRYKVR